MKSKKITIPDEEKGIEMIQYLQTLQNIEESREQAQAGWRAMSEEQKEITVLVYLAIHG